MTDPLLVILLSCYYVSCNCSAQFRTQNQDPLSRGYFVPLMAVRLLPSIYGDRRPCHGDSDPVLIDTKNRYYLFRSSTVLKSSSNQLRISSQPSC